MKNVIRISVNRPAMASEPFLGSIFGLLSFLLRLILSVFSFRPISA